MEKIKQILKENLFGILFLIILTIVVNIELPYYIEAPGGTINLTKRIDENYDKSKGSLNMLYVTEYRGNLVTCLLGKIIPTWDLYKLNNQQVSNENQQEIYIRNRVMLDNSIQNATLVAYKAAGIDINIKSSTNIVIATTKENGINIGDEIISVDNTPIENIQDIRNIISNKNIGDEVKVLVKRNDKEKTIPIILEEDKILGIASITNYEYETPDDLNIAFKGSEGGSSGGLILSLGIYSKITGIDLLKGRNIAGTGTIDENGLVGEIDGIKYKIKGAVKNKMDIILVSPYNYDEAKKVIEDNKYDIELVKVSTLEEAIEYLTK